MMCRRWLRRWWLRGAVHTSTRLDTPDTTAIARRWAGWDARPGWDGLLAAGVGVWNLPPRVSFLFFHAFFASLP
ncbi:hypothetical protein E2C01_062831 [Portunus trituberculatus]|uniref:Uncharacterized protein n=1 Tax=Portunus trituberculatus TaxID=210409 RepID=A0A5B7HIF6_PORTR|nr:hypothetical protein [Portunus trituberculatus]